VKVNIDYYFPGTFDTNYSKDQARAEKNKCSFDTNYSKDQARAKKNKC
jgi:hypothetical protein